MLELNRVHNMNCLEGLRQLPDNFVHCCVTSPPYWGLRKYGDNNDFIWGGNKNCDHVLVDSLCIKCGAWKGQLGLEPSLQMYIRHLVEIFHEVRRVLRPDGTLWLNLGDAYAGGGREKVKSGAGRKQASNKGSLVDPSPIPSGLKQKDLLLMPARVAIALQDDGWYVRDDIVWFKGNPMPESVTDRPTRCHEFIFLMSKSKSYFYDADAVAEPLSQGSITRLSQSTFDQQTGGNKDYGPNSNRSTRRTLENLHKSWKEKSYGGVGLPGERNDGETNKRGRPQEPCGLNKKYLDMHEYGGGGTGLHPKTSGNLERKFGDDRGSPNGHLGGSIPWTGIKRNKRDVWQINCHPYKGAHFATYPEKLIEPCIEAGTSAYGVCPNCGKPWQRIVDKVSLERYELPETDPNYRAERYVGKYTELKGHEGTAQRYTQSTMIGWKPDCACGNLSAVPAIILDPFMGSGTTASVAIKYDRQFIGFEANVEYVQLANKRIYDVCQKALKEMGC